MRKEIVLEVIEPGLSELESIWDYIGYSEQQTTEKLHSIAEQLQRQMFDVISSENQFRVQLDTDIESRKRRAAQICQSLRLPPYFPPRGLPSMRLLEHLDGHIAQFEAEIRQRQARQAELTAQIGELCQRLGLPANAETGERPATASTAAESEESPTTTAAASTVPDDVIPTEQDLERLQAKVSDLEQRRDRMLQRLAGMAEDVRRIALDIECQPAGDFEAAVMSSQEATLPLSDATLAELEALRLRLVKQKAMLVGTCDELRQHIEVMWNRLDIPPEEQAAFLEQYSGYRPSTLEALQEESDKCQELKWSQTGAYLANLRREARELRAACFLEQDEESAATDNDDSEEGVAALERRIDELRESYERNRELYGAVGLYQQTWRAYLEVEQKMKDPAILSNRGGVLLKTDKEKKQLQKELPKVEKKVSELLQRLGGQQFRIQGRTFEQHVQHLWESLRSEQEASRFNRKQQAAAGKPAADDLPRSTQSPMRETSAASSSSPRKSLSATGKR